MIDTTHSTINVFVRQSSRMRKIPFETSLPPDPFYSESNRVVLRESIQQASEGKFVVKTLEELRAMEQ